MENKDILQRLNELEAENARLRRVMEGKPKEITTTVSMWKGNPVITFQGNFRPFSLGLKKASIVIQKIEDIKYFVENNKKFLKTATEEDGQTPAK